MDEFRRTIGSLLQLLVEFGHQVVRVITALEQWLRAQLTFYGVSPDVQSGILIAVMVLLLVATLRVLGGLIRAGVVLFIVLVTLHFLLSMH